jgi:VanZ family protein
MTIEPTPAPRRRLVVLLRAVTVLYWLGLFTVTHIPADRVPPMPLSDKTEHLLCYGALGGLLMLNVWLTRPRLRNAAVVVLVIGMCYGAVDEWTQALPFIHRDCSILDWYADTTGLAIAVIGMTVIGLLLGRAMSSD